MDMFTVREWEILSGVSTFVLAGFWYFYKGMDAIKLLVTEIPRILKNTDNIEKKVDNVDKYVRKHDVEIAELKTEVAHLKYKEYLK